MVSQIGKSISDLVSRSRTCLQLRFYSDSKEETMIQSRLNKKKRIEKERNRFKLVVKRLPYITISTIYIYHVSSVFSHAHATTHVSEMAFFFDPAGSLFVCFNRPRNPRGHRLGIDVDLPFGIAEDIIHLKRYDPKRWISNWQGIH